MAVPDTGTVNVRALVGMVSTPLTGPTLVGANRTATRHRPATTTGAEHGDVLATIVKTASPLSVGPFTVNGLTPVFRMSTSRVFELPTCTFPNSSALGVVASAHVAAASRGFIGLEYHFFDAPWIGQVLDRGRPLFEDGHVVLDDTPGLGGVLDERVCGEHLAAGERLF